MQKRCSSCGKSFRCNVGGHQCWCSDFPPIFQSEAKKDCLCPDCLKAKTQEKIADFVERFKAGKIPNFAPQFTSKTNVLVEGIDYYLENGNYVFTAWSHLKRGHCCGSGCRHCPYLSDQNN